jgi:hypothetical protein
MPQRVRVAQLARDAISSERILRRRRFVKLEQYRQKGMAELLATGVKMDEQVENELSV